MFKIFSKRLENPDFSWWDMIQAIWYLLEDQRASYAFFTFLIFVIQFWFIVPTFVIGKIVDFFTHYKPGMPLTLFYEYALFLGIASAIVSFIRLSAKNILGNIQSRAVYFTKVKGFERLLDFSIVWHDKENTGNKVQRIQNGTNALTQLQTTLSNDVYLNLTAIIGILFAFLFLSPLFFLLSVLYLVIFIGIQISFYKVMIRLNDTYFQLMEQSSGVYYEGLSNVLTLKTLGVKEDFKKNITTKEASTRDHAINMRKIGNNKWKVFQIINALFLVIAILLIGNNFLTGIITLGSIFVFFNYFSNLQNAIGQSTNLIDSLVSYKSSIARMMPIYWEEVPIKTGNKVFPSTWETISLKNASFDYKKNEEKIAEAKDAALKNISLEIQKFEKIGIVGRSGSGKSTFAKMLLGLYEIDSGQFYIGPTNFYHIKHEEVTKNIALILQDSEMFNLSLQENITLMREFDEELFSRAISIAQLEGLIDSLPDGLNTLIGEKGYRLSGGERQRIGIARAIYKDPQILVLDEATSSLDTKTEALIQAAMEEKLQKKTIIMIAHRVTTLKNVDKIYVFEDGKIVEEGKFDKLSRNKKSKFYDMSQYQEHVK